MKKIFGFLLIIFIVTNSYSQLAIENQHCFGGNDDDYATHIIATNDKGYIFCGTALSLDGDVTNSFGNGDYWIIKFDSTMAIQWQKSFGGSGTDEPSTIVQTYDGGYIIGGTSGSNDTDVSSPKGNFDYWIIKINSSGTLLWEKSFGGTNSENLSYLAATPDSGCIVAGFTYSTDGDVTDHIGATDYWLLKLDKNGNKQWAYSFGGTSDDWAMQVLVTLDNKYLVTGSSRSFDGSVSGNYGGYDYWITKINTNGTLDWEKHFGGSNDDFANAAIQLADSSFIIVGSSKSSNYNLTQNYGQYDVWVIKISKTGNLIWQKNIGGTNDDRCYTLCTISDTTFALGAVTASNDIDVNTNYGYYDYWLIKMDTSGTIVYKKSFGGSANDWLYNIKFKNNKFILSGSSNSTDLDVAGQHGIYGGSDAWIVIASDFITWTGTTNNDWNTSSNWSSLTVPTATDNVFIDSVLNYPIINNNTLCNSIIIRPKAAIVINNGFSLTANSLTIESSEAGTGTVIDYGSLITHTAIIKRYLSGNSIHFITSPVQSITAGQAYPDAYIKQYNEPNQTWQNFSMSSNMPVCKGFSVVYNANKTINYIGALNTGAQSIAVSNSNTGDPNVDGWNLCGNPYPSATDWCAATSWTKTNIDNTIYYWNGNQYATYNCGSGTGTNGGSQYIPAMQGFFIKCNNASGGLLSCDNNVRVINQQAFYKQKQPISSLVVSVIGNSNKDQTVINFTNNATNAFDSDYDAYKLLGLSNAPQLFTLIASDSIRAAINSLPEPTSITTVPLGFKTTTSNNFTLTFSGFSTFTHGTILELIDLKNDSTLVLTEHTTYIFASTPIDTIYRFLVRITPAATLLNQNNINSSIFNIYSINNTIYVQNLSDEKKSYTITVYNLLGEKILEMQTSHSFQKLTLTTETGCYLVITTLENYVERKLIYINN